MSGGFRTFVLSVVNNRDGSDKSYVSKRVYSNLPIYGGLEYRAPWSTLGLLIRLQRIFLNLWDWGCSHIPQSCD